MRLKATLLKDYNKERVPQPTLLDPVNVSLYMWPYDILYIKEAQGSIKISGWLDMSVPQSSLPVSRGLNREKNSYGANLGNFWHTYPLSPLFSTVLRLPAPVLRFGELL